MSPSGELSSGGKILRVATYGVGGAVVLKLSGAGDLPDDGLDLSLQVPDLTPTASIGTPTLYPGQSVEVTTTFSADAAGQRVDIDHPAGTKVTEVANSAFSLTEKGATGVLPTGTRSLQFTLTADEEAPLGSATGGGVFWFASRIKLADFSATIVTPPAAPEVSVPQLSVQQGASVEVPVSFNETALGATDIVVPAGIASGSATGGFVWDAALPGFRGTVTESNRDLTLTLTAKPGAPVGAAQGRVTQADSGLDRVWSIIIEAGVPVPDAPLVLESPVWGGSLVPGAPVFSGSGQAGAKVEVVTAWQDRVGDTIVKQDGSWSITWNKALVPGHYVGGSVIQTVGSKAPTRVPYDFFVVRDEVAPLTVTSPRIGQTISDSVPTFTGTAQPGARVVIVGVSGDELGRVDEVAASGSWTITWDKSLLPNRYVGGTVKQYVGGVERGSFTYDFTIVLPKLVVSSPKVGDTIVGTRPTFTGKANPGAEIEITGLWGTPLGKRQADANGDWSITWPKDYAPGPYAGGKVTETVNGKLLRTFVYDFTLVR